MKKTLWAEPRSKKKNNGLAALQNTPPTEVKSESNPVEQKSQAAAEKPRVKIEPSTLEPPPAPEYEPVPPPEYYGAPEPLPDWAPRTEPSKKPTAEKPMPQRKVVAADEGEFRHLKATAEQGLELQGNIVRTLRKSDAPSASRVMRLLARGVTVRERDDYIGFVSPDDVFLQMGEPTVTSVLNSVLDALNVKKRAKIERTEDDLYQQDIAKAKQLFSRDGVVIAE